MPNIVLLTFANDRSAYLEQLKEESRTIFQTLSPLEERGAIKLIREENAETRDLINHISRHGNDILVFHFGGHADDETLHFESEAGHAEGLAELLGKLPNLKLVFLNGCSTRGQVTRLLDEGVPAVIATQSPIDDNKARTFAEIFYHNLAHQGSIRRAFELARAGLLTRFSNMPADGLKLVPVSRGVKLPEAEGGDSIPWGLFYLQEKEELLDWTLPSHRVRNEEQESTFRPNEFLKYVPQAMAEASDTFAQRLKETSSEREALKLMVEHFPWNIGSQVARLVGLQPPLSAPTPERLEQILSTFLACKQFIYFVTLSELWQEVDAHNPDAVREELHQVFNLTRENAMSFDFLGSSTRLQQHMEAMNVSYFVPELKGLAADLEPASAGGVAQSYLDSVMDRYLKSGAQAFENDLTTVCSEAEKYLSVWLYRLAFLADYWMVTVRDIKIERPRHREATFKHKVGRLNAFTENLLGLYEEPRKFSKFFFDNCVILFKDLSEARECLVLTPFYIDKNAYVADRPPQMQLFTYAFKSPEERPNAQYHFVNSGQNLFRAFAEDRYQLDTGIELGGGSDQAMARALMPWEKKTAHGVHPYAPLKEQFDTLN